MLLKFSCKNFKSFRDGFDFSMKPEKRMNELKDSILKENAPNLDEEALAASVIYGPNAAGKTSVVNAMSCLRQIVMWGNIQDAAGGISGDRVNRCMNSCPFDFSDETAPVEFDVTFTNNGFKYRYVLAMMLGLFHDETAERYVSRELLYVNDDLIFDRNRDQVAELRLSTVSEWLNVGYEISTEENTRRLMSNNLVHDCLLLTTDFNSFCSKKIVREVTSWLKENFIIFNQPITVSYHSGNKICSELDLIKNYINRIAKEAGIIGTSFAYETDNDSKFAKLISVIRRNEDKLFGMDVSAIESAGTIRLISIIPIIIAALKRGAVLVMDEFDTSLHPMITMNLITLFHNSRVNKKGAQLIFNTQNPIYLNNKLLRRDEIKFVEREDETGNSIHYALSDFKTADGVRKGEDYMNNYFVSRYGAIKDVDFSPILEKVIVGSGVTADE